MANGIEPSTTLALVDDTSDYGSDFSPEEEQIVNRLLNPDIEDNPIINGVEFQDARPKLRLPRVRGREELSPVLQAHKAAEQIHEQIASQFKGGEYPDLSDQFREGRGELEKSAVEEVPADPAVPDTRSPLERFRTQPKKALSVTDLVSPAWCELQYWYTLTKHGRKRRTSAMKAGSKVHQALEDQVHTTVRVEVQSREDAWGLRIWNVIQGLRTLRYSGQTRELEIWGTIDGQVVNGIIDELSYVCPDPDLERKQPLPPRPDAILPPNQTTLENYFKAQQDAPEQTSLLDFLKAHKAEQEEMLMKPPGPKIYLCDVKTRGVRTVPNAASFKPTKIQLMLYHKLISALATNMVDFSILTTRYNLDPNLVFSDAFIAQVGSLNDEFPHDSDAPPNPTPDSDPIWSSQDSMTILLAHNTLAALWSRMITEFQYTLPHGAESLGSVLKAEYRSRDDGEIMGVKTFIMDEAELSSFIGHEMEWWRGKREAEGVQIDEAFKCRSCDFAEECQWRLKKIEEAKEKARMSKRRTAAV